MIPAGFEPAEEWVVLPIYLWAAVCEGLKKAQIRRAEERRYA